MAHFADGTASAGCLRLDTCHDRYLPPNKRIGQTGARELEVAFHVRHRDAHGRLVDEGRQGLLVIAGTKGVPAHGRLTVWHYPFVTCRLQMEAGVYGPVQTGGPSTRPATVTLLKYARLYGLTPGAATKDVARGLCKVSAPEGRRAPWKVRVNDECRTLDAVRGVSVRARHPRPSCHAPINVL